MSYHRGDGPVNENGTSTKALCSPHFREVETILWARGLTWHAEPMGVSRKILALRHRGAAEDLRNRG